MRRLVLDTNILIIAALFKGSTPQRALIRARSQAILLVSVDTLAEFRTVLLSQKFDKHLGRAERQAAVEEYSQLCAVVPVQVRISVCRDARDDKFLEVAIHGQADAIIAGDRDLLALDPFRGIRILSPADFLEWRG